MSGSSTSTSGTFDGGAAVSLMTTTKGLGPEPALTTARPRASRASR